jgi:hypothetical protein
MVDKTTQKMAVQVAKEIIVKFIEIGRISPTNFHQFFAPIYKEVLKTISNTTPSQNPDKNEQV